MIINKKRIGIILLTFLVIVVVFSFIKIIYKNNNVVVDAASNNVITSSSSNAVIANSIVKKIIQEPITNALARVTKKPFGIKVSPGHSPVTPEKFSGYHTGTDFETTAAEENIDVPVYALCDGNLLMEKTATGYGGVVIQACKLNNQSVTIIYGHLKLTSVKAAVGTKFNAGTQIGILGKAYSSETGGERKHLHLGIHKGTAINILGYVQKQSQLKDWLNVLNFLK